jgi:deoxyribonuclease-4
MLLGAHVPTAGGLDQAPARGRDTTADAIQVFTRNQVQWRARPLAPEEVRAFRVALAETGVRHVLSHGSCLVNLTGLVSHGRGRA